MDTTCFRFMQDKSIRRYCAFLSGHIFVLLTAAVLFCCCMTDSAKTMLLSHDEAVASSLIEQGVSENIIAKALTATDTVRSHKGFALLQKMGIRPALETQFLPHLHDFQKHAIFSALAVVLPICLLLLGGSLLFFHHRENVYRRASTIIEHYINGLHTERLPQTSEGALYQLFSSVDRLATMLQAQNETEQKAKIFLRNTISDISHQLKTPLAALSMYQEIMENEYDTPAVIQKFAAKTGLALKRMEQLIQSMLKITRLDTGNVVFEKKICSLSELISDAVSELTTRAVAENKTIMLDGSDTDLLSCDAAWTSEAISSIVKNALDHMHANGTVRITWEISPFTGIIRISDNGSGIAPEDIHHIFKRFYRSSQSSDTPGIGLGLPLAKSIIEGQGGTISLQSTLHVGTTFTLLLPV
ncbi:MAG: HAMP domain-containing histidine kinase [Lachnospiraceae bacterium]|nr:HAMP domain-containing histidine kinase [Lachnospiraceae bacterium]